MKPACDWRLLPLAILRAPAKVRDREREEGNKILLPPPNSGRYSNLFAFSSLHSQLIWRQSMSAWYQSCVSHNQNVLLCRVELNAARIVGRKQCMVVLAAFRPSILRWEGLYLNVFWVEFMLLLQIDKMQLNVQIVSVSLIKQNSLEIQWFMLQNPKIRS